MKQALLLLLLIPVLVLGYGFWHSSTHGSVYIDLLFKSEANQDLLSEAEVFFLDKNNKLLASGVRDKKQNYIYLIHPEIGNCHENVKSLTFEERSQQWKQCFEILSKWIPTWINKTHQVQVKHKNCISKKLPVDISAHNKEWLLWWVPLPHVGGKPYSYFRISIVVEENDCIR